MKTFWLNFPFNNCNKSGGRWNVPATQGAPVSLPPDWPLQLVVYWFRVLRWCHYSQLTFGSHSSDVESSGRHLNVGERGRRHLAVWPLSLFSYLGTSWTERCRLVRLLYTTANMTLVCAWCQVVLPVRAVLFVHKPVQAKWRSHVGVYQEEPHGWTVLTVDCVTPSLYLFLTLKPCITNNIILFH